jgi:hypothetical protein
MKDKIKLAEIALDKLGRKRFMRNLTPSDCYKFIEEHGEATHIALMRTVNGATP